MQNGSLKRQTIIHNVEKSTRSSLSANYIFIVHIIAHQLTRPTTNILLSHNQIMPGSPASFYHFLMPFDHQSVKEFGLQEACLPAILTLVFSLGLAVALAYVVGR